MEEAIDAVTRVVPMKSFLTLTSFCIFFSASNCGQPPEDNFVISPLVKASVDHVLKVADEQQPSSKNPENLRRALGQTGKLLDKPTIAWARKYEGRNLQAKVVYLAITLPSQEVQLKEVYEYYFRNGGEMYFREREREREELLKLGEKVPPLERIKPHILLGPSFRAEHVTEKYRPVWEGLALLSRFESSLDRDSDTLTDALTRIGNPNSAVICAYRSWPARQATLATPRDEFFTLAALPSQTTLHVLLETLAKWQTERPVPPVLPVKARSGIPGLTEGDDSAPHSQGANWKQAVATACEALQYRCQERKEVSDSWKAVFADFPSNEVVPPLAEIFEQLNGSTK